MSGLQHIHQCQLIEKDCWTGDRARAWQVGPRIEALKRGPWHHRCWKQDPVKEDHSSTYFNIFQCKVYINFCQPIENHCPRGDRARASQVCPRVEALKRRPSHPRCWKQDPVTEDHSSTYFNIFQCKVYINLCQPIENHCPRGDRARAWQVGPRVEALKRGPWHHRCWKQDPVKEDHSSTYFNIFQCKVYINFCQPIENHCPRGDRARAWQLCPRVEALKRRPSHPRCWKQDPVTEDHSSTYFNIFQCKVYINLCQPIENHCPRGDRARAWQVGPRVEALKRGPWHHRCWKQDPVKEDHSSTYFNIFQCKVYINLCQPIENHCPRGDRARAWQLCPRVEALKRGPWHPSCWKQDPVKEDHSTTYFIIFQCKVYINLWQPIENHCPRGDRARAWQIGPRVEALKRGPWHPSCWKQEYQKWRKTILQHISTYFNAKSILTYASLLKSLPTWRQGTCMTDWSSCRGSEMWSVTSQVLKTRTPAVKEDPFWFLIFFQHISTYLNTKSRCLRLPSTSLPPYIIKCPYRGVAHEAELW